MKDVILAAEVDARPRLLAENRFGRTPTSRNVHSNVLLELKPAPKLWRRVKYGEFEVRKSLAFADPCKLPSRADEYICFLFVV
jgi:hypothetical protein